MQKRPKFILHYEPDLPEDFPIAYTDYTAKDEDVPYLHFHQMLELGYCHYGTGTFYIGKEVHTFYEGDVSLIFPYQPHIISKTGVFTQSYWHFIYIDASKLLEKVGECDASFWHRMEQGSGSIPNLFGATQFPEIHRLVGMIIREFELGTPSQAYIKALVWALMVRLEEMICPETDTDCKFLEDRYQIIVPAINFMSKHYAENIEVEQLAAMCFCSVTHFRRIFKAVMGCTPMRYLAEIRIKVADTLLRTTKMSICNISMSVGYDNVSSFNRKYVQLRNMSPTEFRNC